jgi:hypothetical protein
MKPEEEQNMSKPLILVTGATTVKGDILYVDGGAHFGRW